MYLGIFQNVHRLATLRCGYNEVVALSLAMKNLIRWHHPDQAHRQPPVHPARVAGAAERPSPPETLGTPSRPCVIDNDGAISALDATTKILSTVCYTPY